MRISQKAFNEIVRENIEDFEYPVEEAIQEAIKEAKLQGYDVSGILQTVNAVMLDDDAVELLIARVKEADSLLEAADVVNQAFPVPDYEMLKPTVVSVLLDKISEQSTVEEQSALIRILISLVSDDSIDCINSDKLLSLLLNGVQSTDSPLRLSALKCLHTFLPQCEAISNSLCDRGLIRCLVRLLNSDSEEELLWVLKCFVDLDKNASDERVHLQRIRAITENEGIFDTCMDLYSRFASSRAAQLHLNRFVTVVAKSNSVCETLESLHILDALQRQFTLLTEEHSEEEASLLVSLFQLAGTLGFADKLKLPLFEMMKSVLPSLLPRYRENPVVMASLCNCLTTVCLRRKETYPVLVETFQMHRVCLECLQRFPDNGTLHRACYGLLRCLVQNCHECEAYLVKNGLLEVLEADKKKGLGQMVQQMRIALKSVDLNA
ncbi:hypothetical protein AV274_5314 [Blastocystis sp. ATCC 50177/Nand II]|uniref:Uncharacterized protein n=1 Tax=Blastocystis sp. subtype 1 (strain ATCC 50177 / NandII) TaxID=478820 RepID=A0A196S9J5_BLAHN|nr:hypothetical protein AV274_5314 [Blastocystis sp. ATCC 50177/Nand II]